LALGPDFTHVDSDLLEYASKRGKYVHKCVELMNKKTLDPKSVDLAIKPYVDSYSSFLKESKFEPIYNEKGEYSNSHQYCMRIDLIGKLNNKKVLIDIKTASSVDKSVEIQLSSYHMGFCENNPDFKLEDAYYLQLKKTGYKLEPVDIRYSVWTSALEVFKWKVQKGIIKCPIKI